MKLTPLTLLFVCAAPARADGPARAWLDACAARLDGAYFRCSLGECLTIDVGAAR